MLDSFSFILLFIIFAGSIQLIFILTSQSSEEKTDMSGRDLSQKMDELDKGSGQTIITALAGAFVGFFTTLIWVSIFMVVVRSALPESTRFAIAIDTALLKPYFYQVVYWIYRSVELFTPGHVPAIFQIVF